MLKINGVEHEYTKAVNVFNFDKLGHPDGSGSWGILFTIEDNFADPLHIYIGLKFDVVSVSSSRFVATWFNMEKKHKDLVKAVRQRVDMNFLQQDTSEYNINTADEDHFYKFYLDIHEIKIDIVELAKMIYQKPIHIREYANIVKNKAFNIGASRSARAVSAKMLRTYEGNLEAFSYVFTGSDRLNIINGLILDDSLIADDIKYTIWLTPHDLEEGLFYESGDIGYEPGDEYTESIGAGHVLGDIMTPLFTANRSGFRNGYLDISAENPAVNHGYVNAESSMFDTYMWGIREIAMPHRHQSLISIDASYHNNCPKRLSLLMSNPGDKAVSTIKSIQDDIIKTTLIENFVGKGGERTPSVNNFIQNSFIDEALSVAGAPEKILKAGIYIQQCKDYLVDTLVVPLCLHNVLSDLTNLNMLDMQNSIIIIHHPVLDKNIFFDATILDTVELSSSSFTFVVDGLEYGYRTDGSHGEFYWAGIAKPFRHNDNIWMNLKGIMYEKGVIPEVPPYLPYSEELAYLTDSRISIFEDLEHEGDYGTIMAVRKNDFIDIIRKRVGVVSSDYIFGIPGGNINIPRDSIWM